MALIRKSQPISLINQDQQGTSLPLMRNQGCRGLARPKGPHEAHERSQTETARDLSAYLSIKAGRLLPSGLKQAILDGIHSSNAEGLFGFVRDTAVETPTAGLALLGRFIPVSLARKVDQSISVTDLCPEAYPVPFSERLAQALKKRPENALRAFGSPWRSARRRSGPSIP